MCIRDRESPISCEGAVTLFRANTMRSEVEWVSSRILSLVREEGYRFRDIGLVARDYGAYQDLIESVLPR